MELINEIVEVRNFWEAWVSVKRNHGAAGIDKMPTDELDVYLSKHMDEIVSSICAKKYKPSPVRRVYIPKPNGKQRPLGIPTVVDRVVQQAAAQVLSRVYEPVFSEHSYGFRPQRSYHMAIRKALEYLNDGYEWVVDFDIFVKSEMAANRVMASVSNWLERKLRLKVSATKTKVVRPTKSKFLGFTFWKSTKGWECKPTDTAKQKLEIKVKEVLLRKRAVAKSLSFVFTKLNQIVQGWVNYYHIGSMGTYLRDKFGPWLRHKVRVVIVKQWKKCGTIYKNLLTLKKIIKSNLDDNSIYQAAMTRLGWYRQCGLSVFNFLLSPKVLAMPKVNRTDKRKSRPGLVDPYALYQSLRSPICM